MGDKISNLRRINTTRTMTSSFAKLRRRVLLLLLVYSAFIFSASSSSSSSSSSVRLSTATSREGMFGKSFKWETCDDEDKEGKDIELISVALNPDPVRTGGTAKFILRG